MWRCGGADTQGEDRLVRTKVEIGNESPTRQGTPRTAVSHQKLERGTEGSSLEPLEGEWPFQHLESGLLASELWQDTFLLSAHQVCGNLLWVSGSSYQLIGMKSHSVYFIVFGFLRSHCDYQIYPYFRIELELILFQCCVIFHLINIPQCIYLL